MTLCGGKGEGRGGMVVIWLRQLSSESTLLTKIEWRSARELWWRVKQVRASFKQSVVVLRIVCSAVVGQTSC